MVLLVFAVVCGVAKWWKDFQVMMQKMQFWFWGALRAEKSVSRQAGFSLLEVAIAMTVIGLLVATALQEYQIHKHRVIKAQTDANMASVELALGKFIVTNGRYPCPMAQRTQNGDAAFGEEDCSYSGPSDCNLGSLTSKMLCQGPGSPDKEDPLAGPQNVLVGALPFNTLGIPMKQALDGYSRRMTYAVSKKLTEVGMLTEQMEKRRAVRMDQQFTDLREFIPNTTTPNPDYQSTIRAVDSDNGNNQVPDDIAIVSHGENGIGAWTVDGVQYKPCGPSTLSDPSENENCDLDGYFVDTKGEIFKSGAVFMNDDKLLRTIWSETNYWLQDPDRIYFKYERNVGVGIDAPEKSLDVAGNIKADSADVNAGNLRTGYICADDNLAMNAYCFKPERISGSGMDCGDGLLVGVYSGEPDPVTGVYPGGAPICASGTITGINALNCPDGEALTGVAADGTAQCAHVPVGGP